MRIKFIKPDPRAGAIAQMDSSRGRQLVAAGAAIEVKEDGTEVHAEPISPAQGRTDSSTPAARETSGDGSGEALPPVGNDARDAPADTAPAANDQPASEVARASTGKKAKK